MPLWFSELYRSWRWLSKDSDETLGAKLHSLSQHTDRRLYLSSPRALISWPTPYKMCAYSICIYIYIYINTTQYVLCIPDYSEHPSTSITRPSGPKVDFGTPQLWLVEKQDLRSHPPKVCEIMAFSVLGHYSTFWGSGSAWLMRRPKLQRPNTLFL